jgi:hypothetical protein
MRNEETTSDCIAVGLAVCWVMAALVGLSGCSFKVETGWHGQTGRDDRTQSQLVMEQNEKRKY